MRASGDAVAPSGERGDQVHLVYVDALKDAWADRAEDGRLPSHDELVAAYRRRIADVRPKEAWNGVSLQ